MAGLCRCAAATDRRACDCLMATAAFRRIVTFRRLEIVSFCHSVIYLTLLLCAVALGNPQPATFIFGLAHGTIWIAMSLVCIAAARLRIIPFWLAVTVAVIGGPRPLPRSNRIGGPPP